MERYVLVGLNLKNDRSMKGIISEIKSNLESTSFEYDIESVEAIDFTGEIASLEKVRSDLAAMIEALK